MKEKIRSCVKEILETELKKPDSSLPEIQIGPTKTEFEGDLTVVVFPLVKVLKQKPEIIAEAIGSSLHNMLSEIDSFNVVKGFLNLSLSNDYWNSFLKTHYQSKSFGTSKGGKKVLVEYSSPNTNKPLHLGHIRNILIGWSISQILEAAGHEVVKTQIINDRGIAICKSMLAWKKFGDGETPQSAGVKGDFLVGKYYVLFEQKFREEYREWQENSQAAKQLLEAKSIAPDEREKFFMNFKNEYFNTYSALGSEARELLRAWEANDDDARNLWTKMNNWVYDGFNKTYQSLGVSFDQNYYESDTWLLGKEAVLDGLEKEVFYQKDDGSVWVDLSERGMDQKILLRSDGTSVYMTQDLGTAMLRFKDHLAEKMIYVVGDEQIYHFKVLFNILDILEEPYSEGLFHLAYGMVDLPTGKMKSREGTVVDADDLIDEVIMLASAAAEEKGGIEDLTDKEKKDICRKIGLAALKFFILKVNARKRMVYDPAAALDLQGQTGPYIQNAYVRIQSILRKNKEGFSEDFDLYHNHDDTEIELLRLMSQFQEVILDAADTYDPSGIANFCYDLAKSYHKFYHEKPILAEPIPAARNFRLALSQMVANVLTMGMSLLGIEMPYKM